MITIQSQFNLLKATRVWRTQTATCARHDFSDTPRDPAKRLRTGNVQCSHCGTVVSILCAFFYEHGVRHGEDSPKHP